MAGVAAVADMALDSISESVARISAEGNLAPNPISSNAAWISPAEKVFGTPELAENIFAHLELADLLRAILIDRTSRDIIKTSKTIHRGMSMIPNCRNTIGEAGDPDQLLTTQPLKRYLDFDNAIAFPGKRDFHTSLPPMEYTLPERKNIFVWGFNCNTDQRRSYMTTITKITPRPGSNELWRRIHLVPDARAIEIMVKCPDKDLESAVIGGDLTLGQVYDLLCQASGYTEPRSGDVPFEMNRGREWSRPLLSRVAELERGSDRRRRDAKSYVLRGAKAKRGSCTGCCR